jgi:6-phospho-3-hexuloisomerase
VRTGKEIASKIAAEEKEMLANMDEQAFDRLIERILSARRIFAFGAGRSALILRAFAMRLMQMGFSCFAVGDVTTPAIGEGDLLILGSGSGETEGVLRAAERAQSAKATVFAVTMREASRLFAIANDAIVLPGENDKNALGATAFEGAMLLVFDAAIEALIERKPIPDAGGLLRRNHANLE